MSNESNAGKNAALLLAGAVLGAVAGLLLAPKKGSETREDLADWLSQRRAKGADLLGRIREELPAKTEQLAAALKAGKQAYYQTNNKPTEKDAINN